MWPSVKSFFTDKTVFVGAIRSFLFLMPVILASLLGLTWDIDGLRKLIIMQAVFSAMAGFIRAGNKNSDPQHPPVDVTSVAVEVKSTAPRDAGFGIIQVLCFIALFCGIVMLNGCIPSWTAAEKAAPACYGLNATSLTTLVSEGKTIALSTAAGCAAGTPTCITAVEGAVGTYLANKQLDDQAFQCAVEAIKLEIQYPNGGEAPYSPDAGPAPAKMAKVHGGGPELSDSDTTAVEGLNSLSFNHANYHK